MRWGMDRLHQLLSRTFSLEIKLVDGRSQVANIFGGNTKKSHARAMPAHDHRFHQHKSIRCVKGDIYEKP